MMCDRTFCRLLRLAMLSGFLVLDQRPMSLALRSNGPQQVPGIDLCHTAPQEGTCNTLPHNEGEAMRHILRPLALFTACSTLALPSLAWAQTATGIPPQITTPDK